MAWEIVNFPLETSPLQVESFTFWPTFSTYEHWFVKVVKHFTWLWNGTSVYNGHLSDTCCQMFGSETVFTISVWNNRWPNPDISVRCMIGYSPWNVLLSHLNGERTLSERWTNAERTQSERCVNAERNLVNDMWTVNGERTQNANGAQTRALSKRWTQGERKMNDLFGKPRVFSSALSI